MADENSPPAALDYVQEVEAKVASLEACLVELETLIKNLIAKYFGPHA